MGAPKGNKFWEARSSHGRNPIFETDEQLWDAALEYFNWVEENPLYEAKAFSFQGEVTVENLPKMRAMTIKGLCIHLDISEDTFLAYSKKKDFIGVTTRIRNIIDTQKFTGAAADLLNPNIIARDLGLSDKQEVGQKTVSMDIPDDTDPVEAAKMYKDFMSGN